MKDVALLAARGTAFGAYNFIVGAAAMPAGLLMGGLWAWQGHRVALTVGALIATAAAAALLLIFWEVSRAPAEAAETERIP